MAPVVAGLAYVSLHEQLSATASEQRVGQEKGMLGVVFRKAQNRIQDPAKLRRLIVDLIDREQWMTLDVDVKGDAYEGLLERNAEDLKSGAGQYLCRGR